MKQKNNDLINFGKAEFKELMIPMTLFILIIIIVTCIVAVYETCVVI